MVCVHLLALVRVENAGNGSTYKQYHIEVYQYQYVIFML